MTRGTGYQRSGTVLLGAAGRGAPGSTTVAAGYIVNASRMRAQHELQEQLHTAIESRDVIGQAKGVLMAREQVTADEAFQMLRSRSQSNNVKLRDVARRVVESASPS